MKKVGFFTFTVIMICSMVIFNQSCKKDKDEITPEQDNTFTDSRDGQVYDTVTIGTQTWMAENLNYETVDSWFYDNSSTNGEIYGRLYTLEAANNTCPVGWHLPSESEWIELTDYLAANGHSGTEGTALKATSGWDDNMDGPGNGTNDYGFTALPGGYRNVDGIFNYIDNDGFWWSSTKEDSTDAWNMRLNWDADGYNWSYYSEMNGFSVRCVKD